MGKVTNVLLAAILLAIIALAVIAYPSECSMCGASVHDVWSVRGNDGFVKVCQECYRDMRE